MISAVVFSKDRAMQLDLLLRSLPHMIRRPVNVIYKATDDDHQHAYDACILDHLGTAAFYAERDGGLPRHAQDLIPVHGLACFLTDDDVFYRKPLVPTRLADDVVCHSFRLGRNTTWCYPHGQPQTTPTFLPVAGQKLLVWMWQGADGDFGYPGSLDGHVFRATHLRRMLNTAPNTSPNRIEDHLVRWCIARLASDHPLMSCEDQSSLVSLPINRVNGTHPNRYGDRHPYSASDLLERYLNGERIDLDALDFSDVRGAHQEIELVFR